MYDRVTFVSGGKFVSREPWKHQRRVLNDHELLLVLQGCVCMEVDHRAYTLKPGDLLHIRPGILHEGTQVSEAPVVFYWIHFIGTAEQDVLPAVVGRPAMLAQAEILIKQLLHCANTVEYPSECADYFVRLLLMELMVQQTRQSAASDPLCAAIEEWVRGNSDRPIKVSDAAVHFQFNPDYLNRVFRRFHPEGLKAYIDAVRCQRIKQDLVSTDLTLQELSQNYGFSDYKYFLKYFRIHEGITPSQYRSAYYRTHINCK